MPDNSLGSSFAIVNSPSLTPELLANSAGSFYTIQNLRSTYLLSALHSQSNSFTVHSIDIHLKPLFLYKIPRDCVDILISSNILYSIQYVDYYSDVGSPAIPSKGSNNQKLEQINQNTEKENRDMDIEKNEKYADDIAVVMEDLNDGDEASQQHNHRIAKGDANQEDSLAETSAASSTSDHYSQDSLTPCNSINAVGVISSAMASLRKGDEDVC